MIDEHDRAVLKGPFQGRARFGGVSATQPNCLHCLHKVLGYEHQFGSGWLDFPL